MYKHFAADATNARARAFTSKDTHKRWSPQAVVDTGDEFAFHQPLFRSCRGGFAQSRRIDKIVVAAVRLGDV